MSLEVSERSVVKVLDGYDRAGEKLVNDLMNELITTGFLIESGYKINVLVDTGRLRSSVHTEWKLEGKDRQGGQEFQLKDDEVKVGSNVNYAEHVEFRHKNFALTDAYRKETAGLMQRLQKIIDDTGK